HLSYLAESIDKVNREIFALECVLEAKKQTLSLLDRQRSTYYNLRAPMRSIPPELLGLVFGSLFGDAPFGASEYRQFACISSVCSTWREAAHTTPNLCKGLSID
ncbi:hypothetical protein BKA70DRAFT_1079687, partial [Coprinopsis sp. MPI-PUGE-AT-0042]